MQYDDLTPYSYNSNWAEEGALNVGWLGSLVPACQKPEQTFLNKLGVLCCNPIHLMRGFHYCEICGANPMSNVDPFFLEYGHHLGNGEIWIRSFSGEIFASPTMIFHYVSDHSYKPPQRFVEAVLKV